MIAVILGLILIMLFVLTDYGAVILYMTGKIVSSIVSFFMGIASVLGVTMIIVKVKLERIGGKI